MQVRAGVLRRQSLESSSYYRDVVEVHVHPEFNRTYLNNDLALLRVGEPFEFSASAAPICLPPLDALKASDYEIRHGDKCVAAGWGRLVSLRRRWKLLRQLKARFAPSRVRPPNRRMIFRKWKFPSPTASVVTMTRKGKSAVDIQKAEKIAVKVGQVVA